MTPARSANEMPRSTTKPFDLVERREMSRVRRVAPVTTPRHDGVDRQRFVRDRLLHQMDLRRRGVRAKDHGLGFTQVDVERVPQSARRVRRWDIERLEVVPVAFDLRALRRR